jgi:hypothetical protein
MTVLVFPDANDAVRCARAGLYMTQHHPIDSRAYALGRLGRTFP